MQSIFYLETYAHIHFRKTVRTRTELSALAHSRRITDDVAAVRASAPNFPPCVGRALTSQPQPAVCSVPLSLLTRASCSLLLPCPSHTGWATGCPFPPSSCSGTLLDPASLPHAHPGHHRPSPAAVEPLQKTDLPWTLPQQRRRSHAVPLLRAAFLHCL